MIDGKLRNLSSRRFCLSCSPFGERGTSLRAKTWTDAEFIEASKCNSITAALNMLGLVQAGGNFASFKKHALRLNIDLTHMNPHSKTATRDKSRLLEKLTKNSALSKTTLRHLIKRYNLINYHCHSPKCSIKDIWNDTEIILQLDHINGVNDDNRLENLRWLCPNCHSQTPTYARAKNRNNRI